LIGLFCYLEYPDPVRSYAKWYGVNRLCALIELKAIGMDITDQQIEQQKLLQNQQGIRNAAAKRKKLEEQVLFEESNEYLSFIVGYTSGGAPFGTAHDE
jgi:hypothetical protein